MWALFSLTARYERDRKEEREKEERKMDWKILYFFKYATSDPGE